MNSSDVRVALDGEHVKIGLSGAVCDAAVSLEDMLPVLRSVTNSVVEAAIQRETLAARSISLKAGCGACCRQLVPITSTEARRIPALLASLADEHRTRVMSRFEAARARLQDTKMWDRLESLASLSPDERGTLSLEYLALGIACPFLEDESCSIHAERPLACRQHLVTSPARNYQKPTRESISRVALAANVHDAVKRLETRDSAESRFDVLSTSVFRSPDQASAVHTVREWMRDLLAEAQASGAAASVAAPAE